MTSHGRRLFIVTMISFFPIFSGTLSLNVFDQQPKSAKMRVISDMRRIRELLQSYRSLLTSRELYREYYNMLKTLWTCCPLQRDFLFDRRDVHQTILDMSDCRENIRHNQSQLSTKCFVNLKLFIPSVRDLPK